GEQIRAEGFDLHPLRWRRHADGAFGAARALAEIARLYRAERPDILHHVALKPVLFGAIAAGMAFGRSRGPAQIAAVAGLGSRIKAGRLLARIGDPALRRALRFAVRGGRGLGQKPEDRAALIGLRAQPAPIPPIPRSA